MTMNGVSSQLRLLGVVVCVVGSVWLSACGGGPSSEPPRPAEAPAAQPSSSPLEPAGPPTGSSGTPSNQASGLPALTPPPNLDLTRAPEIPLASGLVVVSAVVEERGDYEVVKRVAVGPERIQISYSATIPVGGVPTEARGTRTVFAQDLKTARIYRIRWLSGRSEVARGTTALGVSAEVLLELRKDGRSECSLASIDEAGTLIGAIGLPSPEYEGVFERVEPGPVALPVVVDGERQWLPAIHARGTFEGLAGDIDTEFWFLDNPDNPLTLRGRIGQATLVTIRIDRPLASKASQLERALTEEDRIELPGVYFEFASAKLRPESDDAIAVVADVLRRHPDWRLRFDGHTDNVGGAAANLELSRARAGAVRAAVAARLGGAATRFESAGFGLGQPRETNDTPEGRARNRRVEIVRLR